MDYTLKKSLGQHFLKDDKVCLKIVDLAISSVCSPLGSKVENSIYTISITIIDLIFSKIKTDIGMKVKNG